MFIFSGLRNCTDFRGVQNPGECHLETVRWVNLDRSDRLCGCLVYSAGVAKDKCGGKMHQSLNLTHRHIFPLMCLTSWLFLLFLKWSLTAVIIIIVIPWILYRNSLSVCACYATGWNCLAFVSGAGIACWRCVGLAVLLDAASWVQYSSGEYFYSRGDFPLGVNLGSDSIPQ